MLDMNTYARIKETVIDWAHDRVSVEERFDITRAMQQYAHTSGANRRSMEYVALYAFGYTSPEIARIYGVVTDEIEQELARGLIALATAMGMYDTPLFRDIPRKNHELLTGFLVYHSTTFTMHDVRDIAHGYRSSRTSGNH